MQIARLQEEQLTKEEVHQAHLGAAKDIAFRDGKIAGKEETAVELQKLRDLIETLRSESSAKSKRLIEVQFEAEELQKAKRKATEELEETAAKLTREREQQRDMQQRLEVLIQEVKYLKSIAGRVNSSFSQ